MRTIRTLLTAVILAPSVVTAAAPQPVTTDVFVADGVHTYRIPAMMLSPSGAVLVFCEARKESIRDAPSKVMRLPRMRYVAKEWTLPESLARTSISTCNVTPRRSN